MRAIIFMCLAWSIVIVATPGLADRYVSNASAVSATAALSEDRPSAANRAARIERISDLRTDCRRGEGLVAAVDNDAYAAQPMPAAFDVVDRRGATGTQGETGMREAGFAGLCR